jgi:hypothetical protein
MNKRATFFLSTAAVIQLLTAAIHSLSFLRTPQPANDSERQLMDLMSGYHMDMGAGFYPTMLDLFNSLSAGYALLGLFAGLVNLFLLRRLDASASKGLLNINLLVFGILLVVFWFLAFLPPVTLTALAFFALLGARLSLRAV